MACLKERIHKSQGERDKREELLLQSQTLQTLQTLQATGTTGETRRCGRPRRPVFILHSQSIQRVCCVTRVQTTS